MKITFTIYIERSTAVKHKVIAGQVDIFEILESTTIDYPKEIAKGLMYHCIYWNYDHIIKFNKGKKTAEAFIKAFCNISKTEFLDIKGDTYNITFDKKELNAMVKRCGADYDKRDFDAVITIEEIIRELPTTEEYECTKENTTKNEAYRLSVGKPRSINNNSNNTDKEGSN